MRLNKEISKYYYTAAQARKTLGLDEQAFQYWVRKGRIKKVTLPGRAQGVYSKKEVDSLSDQVTATIVTEQPEGIEFRKATIDDLEAEYELAYLIFGKGAHSIEVRSGFMLQNLDITYHLYDRGKLVASIQIIPFNHKTVESFVNGQIRGWEIDPRNVEPFTPNKPLECILMEMMTTPMVPPQQRGIYGAQLLMGLSKVFTTWGEHGIIISKLYATSSTPTGIHIIKSAGFQVIKDLGRGRYAFELDVETSDAKIIKHYQEALKEWKEKQKAKNKRTRKSVVQSVGAQS
jgi:hypothetical protein